MRYLSFQLEGRRTYGVVRGRGIVDVGARVGEWLPDLPQYLEALSSGFSPPVFDTYSSDCTIDDVSYLPVCQPRKIVGVGLNYEGHRAETGRPKAAHPTLFSRFADTIVGHRAPLIRPPVSEAFDYEGELAVIIG